MRCIAAILIASGLHALSAHAQQRIIVPEGSAVVVPPRGVAALPQQPSAEAPRLPPRAATPTATQPGRPAAAEGSRDTLAAAPPADGERWQIIGGGALGGSGWGLAAPLALLPLAAVGALAAGSVPGGGGGTSAPSRTR